MQMARVILPNGLWLDNRRLTVAGLRPLSGYDEAYLLAQREMLSPARWTSEVLTRCIVSLDEIAPVPLSYVQALTVGDREALLLHLRRLTFGEQLSCVLACPACATKLSLDVGVSQLLLPPYESPGYWYRLSLAESGLTVTFRLPTGADQEAIAMLAPDDAPGAVAMLVERCLHDVKSGDQALDVLPEEWIPLLGEQMSEHDPQAELVLNNHCPQCQHDFRVLLDCGQFFAEEIHQRIRFLYREVHLLAWYYHWSEADILQMTRPHRQIYLELLDETIGEVRS